MEADQREPPRTPPRQRHASSADTGRTPSPAHSFSSNTDDSDFYDIDFGFWQDDGDISVFDLLGTAWREDAKLALAAAAKRLQALKDKHGASRKRLEDARVRMVAAVDRHFSKVEHKFKRPDLTRKRDKVAFLFGVTNLWFTSFLIGAYPEWVPHWISLQAVVLVFLRWGTYRIKRWHYFLFDYCYLTNALLLLWLLFFRNSRALYLILYASAHGPLAWAILTWRNSLVFHSLDKMTSCFIHIAPSITLFTLRWRAPSGAASPDSSSATLFELIGYVSIYFAFWQSAYYILVLHRRKHKVFRLNYVTSYTWLVHDTGTIGRLLGAFGDEWRLPCFIAMQYLYTILSAIPCLFMQHSQLLNALFLAGILSVSVWNGANFYIDVFSARYITDLQKLEKDFKDQIQAIPSSSLSPSASFDGRGHQDDTGKTKAT